MAKATMKELWARLDLSGAPFAMEHHVIEAYDAGRLDNDEARRLAESVQKSAKRITDSYSSTQGHDA